MIPNKLIFKFTLLLLFVLNPAICEAKNILIYGDRLSAAYGMELHKGWAHLLSDELSPEHSVINASISGETSAGGRARLGITLDEFKPDLLLLELGANDGLQGLPIKNLRQNLEAMILQAQAYNVTIVLGGISLPASYGPRYIDQFRSVYSDLASEYELPFIDFYREDFITTPGYIQEDGLHPTEVTQTIVRDMVLDFMRRKNLLEDEPGQ